MKFLLSLKSILLRTVSLKTTTTPKVAFSFTLGFYLALFPVTGTTTLLCFVFSRVFKLNHYIVQGLNLILSPVQLMLIFPFVKAGNYLFLGNRPVLPPQVWQSGLKAFNKSAGIQLFESLTAGVAIWLMLLVLTAPLLYFLIFSLAKFSKSQSVR